MKKQFFTKALALSIMLCSVNLFTNAQIHQNNVRIVDTVYTPVGYPEGPLNSILWLPSVTNGAAVVVMHGSSGTPDQMHLWGDNLSARGYVVLSIDYYDFFNAYGVPTIYPAPVRAVKTAVEFLRKNSLKFGNYSNKIACIGGSEGAQQSARAIIWDNDDAFFGTDPNINDHFDASVLYYGFYDNYNHLESLFNNDSASNLSVLMNSYYAPHPADRAGKGNVIANVNNITTPILMFHGTGDQILNYEQSVEFRDSLLADGKNVQLELVPYANHVYEFYNTDTVNIENSDIDFDRWSYKGKISRDTTIAWLARTLQIHNIHCPENKSYWKNHTVDWCSDAIPMQLGTTNSYNQSQMQSILNTSSGNDPSLKLAQELIAAKLNLSNNTVAKAIVSTIIAADNLIGARSIPIVPLIAKNSVQGIKMTLLGNILRAYNNGMFTPNNCNGGNRIAQNNFSDNLLLTIYPNPVSATSTISFLISESQNVSINIFDVNGKLISTLANEEFTEGEHQIEFNSEKLDAGIYFLKIQSGEFLKTEKLVVTK